MKQDVIRGTVLIGAAIVCAVVSNVVASPERKLVLPGYYPNAQQVPARSEAPLAPLTQAATTVTSEPAPPGSVTATTSAAPATSAAPLVVPAATIAGAATPSAKPAVNQNAPVTSTVTTTPAPSAPKHVTSAADVLKRFTPHPDKAYLELHGDDVMALHSAGALFIDARRTSVYEQGHITGSRPVSVWESDVDQKVNQLYEERNDPRAQLAPIVVYCSGGDCEDSHMLAQKLWGLQFNNVYVYKDGFPDWQKRGGATRIGSAP